MSRFRFNFNILTGRKAFRDLKENSPLRKLLETVRSELTERETEEPDTYEFVSDGLNPVYDARFITLASGDDLDKWGETLALPRNSGEADADYRARLLIELRDFTACLTADAIKDAVESLAGVNRPGIEEIHPLAPDWPLEWWENVGNEHVTWCNWDDLVDFLLVLDSEPGGETLEDIAEKIIQTKFAPARCLIVTDSGSGYYVLQKLVD